ARKPRHANELQRSIHRVALPTTRGAPCQSMNAAESGKTSRFGHAGQSASTTCIRSSSASNGSRGCAGSELTPPVLVRGCKATSFELIQDLLKQRLAIEQGEVPSYLVHAQSAAVSSKQCSDVFEILRSARIIDPPLKLECDEAFGANNMQSAEWGIQLRGSLQDLARSRTVGVQKVQALVIAQIICRVWAAMDAVVSDNRECSIDRVCQSGLCE